MAKGTRDVYQELLHLNEEAFSRHLFTVAYHTLSAALYCALDLEDAALVSQTERLASEQLDSLRDYFASQTTLGEPLEVILYSSLLRVANPRRLSSAQDGQSDGLARR